MKKNFWVRAPTDLAKKSRFWAIFGPFWAFFRTFSENFEKNIFLTSNVLNAIKNDPIASEMNFDTFFCQNMPSGT